jgi:hypothetical protein
MFVLLTNLGFSNVKKYVSAWPSLQQCNLQPAETARVGLSTAELKVRQHFYSFENASPL